MCDGKMRRLRKRLIEHREFEPACTANKI